MPCSNKKYFPQGILIKQGLVKENPLESIKIRANDRDDADRDSLALTPELRCEVLSKFENDLLLKPIVTVLMLTGMRPGELIALKWRDIDFDKASISIHLAASRAIDFDDDGNVTGRRQVISNTKTVLSVRSFKVADTVVECVKDWLAYQKERELKTGIDYTSPSCHVFCQKNGGMRSYSGLKSMLKRFIAKNGLEGHNISLYTFRHTFATMLLEERENPKIVSELMAHSKVLTTLSIYSHVISKSVYEDTAKTLDRGFDKFSPQQKTDVSSKESSVPVSLKFDSNVVNYRGKKSSC